MAVMSLNALLKVACLELYQALNKCLRDVSHWGTQSNAPNLKDVHILISGACDYAMLHTQGVGLRLQMEVRLLLYQLTYARGPI